MLRSSLSSNTTCWEDIRKLALFIGITVILLVACTLLIILAIVYSDDLDATNAKRNNLLLAIFGIVFVIIIGVLVIWKCNSYEDEDENGCDYFIKCGPISSSVTILMVMVSLIAGCGFILHNSVVPIPDSCASHGECQAYCSGINVNLNSQLSDVKNVRLSVFHSAEQYCGTCSCICPSENLNISEEGCDPVENAHFGLSTSTKIALGMETELALILTICVAVKMTLSSNDRYSLIGLSLGIGVILFLLCSLPILFIYGLEATTAKRNNLLIAILVPYFIITIGCFVVFVVSIIGHRSKWGIGKKFWWLAVLVISLVVSPISVSIAVIFGTKFASLTHSCDIKADCHRSAGVSVVTIVVVCLFTSLLAVIISGLTTRYIIKRRSQSSLQTSNSVWSLDYSPDHGNQQDSTRNIKDDRDIALNELNAQNEACPTTVPILPPLKMCLYCGYRPATMLLEPCKHVYMCKPCFDRIKWHEVTCPICGTSMIICANFKCQFNNNLSQHKDMDQQKRELKNNAIQESITNIGDHRIPSAPSFEENKDHVEGNGWGTEMEQLEREWNNAIIGASTVNPIPSAPYMDDNEEHQRNMAKSVNPSKGTSQALANNNRSDTCVSVVGKETNNELGMTLHVNLPVDKSGSACIRNPPPVSSSQGLCLACMDRQATILLKPCKHLCMCRPCWDLYKQDRDICPKCRTKVRMNAIEEIYPN